MDAIAKRRLLWSSFAFFTFIILYPSNPFQTKHHLNSPKDGCGLFEGKWVRVEDGRYANWSCATMPDFKNCLKHGRVDTEFLNWRWKPKGCQLPRFDPERFLRMVRGKTMGFIGDSVSRNHADSLLCLLSKEEVPIQGSNDQHGRWYFPAHHFTLLTLWSKFLVEADEDFVNGSDTGTFNLHLDKVDHNWAHQLPTLDYAIISAGHWFFRPLHLYSNHIKIGCVYCNEPNLTTHSITFAMRMSFRAALRYINNCTLCKQHALTMLRTFSPAHFENGTWNNGGSCSRTKPLRESEVESFYSEISGMQHEEIERARRENVGRFQVLDITRVMAVRADGHPGSHWGNKWMQGYNDCVHWCLPGPIDVWNDFLMAHLH